MAESSLFINKGNVWLSQLKTYATVCRTWKTHTLLALGLITRWLCKRITHKTASPGGRNRDWIVTGRVAGRVLTDVLQAVRVVRGRVPRPVREVVQGVALRDAPAVRVAPAVAPAGVQKAVPGVPVAAHPVAPGVPVVLDRRGNTHGNFIKEYSRSH